MWGMQFSLLRKSFTVSENHKHFHKRDFFFYLETNEIRTLAFLRCDEGTTKLQKKDHHPC